MSRSLKTLTGLYLMLAGTLAMAAPPVAAPSAASTSAQEDGSLNPINLSTIFSDTDPGDVLTYGVVSQSGDLAFTPDVDEITGWVTFTTVPDISGFQEIIFQATDLGAETATYTLGITIDGNDDVPVAVDDSASIDEIDPGEEGSVIIDVLSNDDIADGPAEITIYGVDWPSGATPPQFTNVSESPATTQVDEGGVEITLPNGYLLLLEDNTIEYTPKANFSGLDWFTYQVEDADGDVTTATVTISVAEDNDPPRVWGSYEYTVNQGSFITVDGPSGLLSKTIDDDGDTVQVTLITPPTVGSLSLDSATGAFTFTPPASYGEAGDPPITFEVQYNDLPIAGDDSSAVATVTIAVDPDDDEIEIDPPGEVSQIFDLADVPLEDAVSAEANVLVVMDDSGSMDWGVMTPGPSNLFLINNSSARDRRRVRAYGRYFGYTNDVATNDYRYTYTAIPAQESLDNDPDFANENYGVWRAWNPQYNTIYYNPEYFYEPWVGLGRDGQEFPNANPLRAQLDPYDGRNRWLNLVSENSTYLSRYVPVTRNVRNGYKNVNNTGVHYAHYYTTTAPEGTLPGPNDMGQRIDIRSNYTLNDGTVLPFYPGGEERVDCAEDDGNPLTCTYAQEIQNFANWFTYYRVREYSAKAALGRAIAGASNLRMGYSVLNQTSQRERIESLNASFRIGHKRDLLHRLYTVPSVGGTPLRRALDRAGRTFECVSGNSFFTSGSSPGSYNCPVSAAPQGECQNNFTLLFSDGEWNGGFSITNHDHNSVGNNTLFDGGRYADSWSSTLADIAMHYYERDLHPDLANGVPTTERDRQGAPVNAFTDEGELMHQHMKTFTVGFGLTGSIDPENVPTNYAQSFSWPRPTSSSEAKIDDMLHAAVNGRGQFLSANNPVLLSRVFQDAFAEFADSSVSVSAVAFNSTALREDTVEYRGFFNPKFHNGDLRALSVDAFNGTVDAENPLWRAAVQMDGINPSTRLMVTYDDNTNRGKAFTFNALNADQRGVLNRDEVDWLRGVRDDEEPNGIFRSRQQTEGLLGDIVHSAPVFVGAPRGFRRDQAPYPTGELYSSYVESQQSRRRMVYVGANDGMLHGFDAGTGSGSGTGNELVAFIPNKIIDDSEDWANRLDQLTSLVYAHRFFVDLTPTVEDVYMKPNASTSSKDWTTVLVGGLGAGGKGYFAMNVTDPDNAFSSVNNASEAVLWEFTDQDDTYPVDADGDPLVDDDGDPLLFDGQPVKDLGYTLSQPQVVMTNLNDTDGQKHWAAVFGNGYNSTAGIAKVFALLLDEGYDGWQSGDFIKIDTGVGAPGAPDPLAGMPNGIGGITVVDADGNGTADYAYGGDLFGNLYRFDMSSSNAANWQATKIFQAVRDGVRQPITTQPWVKKFRGTNEGEPDEGFLVVVGTGSWVTDDDGTDTNIQSLYGIWDRLETSPSTALSNARDTRLVEQTLTNIVTNTSQFERQRIVSGNDVSYQPDDTTGGAGVYGWYLDLDPVRPATTLEGAANPDTSGLAPPSPQYPGERAVRRIISRGGTLLIATVVPRDSNTCTQAPPGSLFAVDALTGGNPRRPTIDINNDGEIDEGDLITVDGEQYAAGIVFDNDDLGGTLVDPSMLVGSGDHDFLFISGGDDQITLRLAPPEDQKTGRLSWRQLID